MVLYIRTIAQLPYPRSERVELFADTAEDLDAEQYVGVDRNKIAPGSYCITADGVLYLMNTSGAWVMATSGGGSKEPVLQALTATENGNYIPPKGVDGYNNVTVNVSGGGDSIFEEIEITPTSVVPAPSSDTEFMIGITQEDSDKLIGTYFNGKNIILHINATDALPMCLNSYLSFSGVPDNMLYSSQIIFVGGIFYQFVVLLAKTGAGTWTVQILLRLIEINTPSNGSN